MIQNTAQLIDSWIQQYNRPVTMQEGDYRDSNGIIRCGKCHKPKEAYFHFTQAEIDRKLPIQCDCEKAQAEKERQEKKRKEAAKRAQKYRRYSLMTPDMAKHTFDNFIITKDNERPLEIAKNYADNFTTMYENNQGLLLYGGVGTGKTYTAACIANQLLDKAISVVMTSFVALLGVSDYTSDIDNLNSASLLILDDLGAERTSDYALEKVYKIIDARYRTHKPMILTTNQPLDSMSQQTDIRSARIYDRILSCCYPVRFTGASFRKHEAVKRYREMKEILEGKVKK